MNTIEQAAKRLEALRRSGVTVDMPAPVTTPAPPVATDTAQQPLPPSSVAPSGMATPLPPHVVDVLPVKPAGQPATEASDASSTAEHERRSRQIDLDFLRMSRAGLLVPGNPRSQLEEEFRIIKRPLLENVRGQTAVRPHRANLIMVTSALPNEGKTQTAINLAVSIAMELDHTVLLVEADVIRPSVLSRLGISANKGLLDLLSGPKTDLSDVLLKTNIPKLTLLPAGTASSKSTELLASDLMDKLLEELAHNYPDRVIIFDTPPLLPSTESRVMASLMGQVLMVVEAGKTPLGTIKQAFATVEEHPVVLTMLNKYQGPRGQNAYGYYAP